MNTNNSPIKAKPGRAGFFLRISIWLLALGLTAGVVHFIVFPQESRCILIRFSGTPHAGNIYFRSEETSGKKDSLQVLIKSSEERVKRFWGTLVSRPIFIYCSSPAGFAKYSEIPGVPAVTHLKLGTCVVLSREGADPDIIAHEISHAELYTRIGFFKWNFGVPAWFKHGLAMQNDYRAYYSADSLPARLRAFPDMPSVKDCQTDQQFYSGSRDLVMLRYMLAKQEVGKWYSRDKLIRLTEDIRAGKNFEETYNRQ